MAAWNCWKIVPVRENLMNTNHEEILASCFCMLKFGMLELVESPSLYTYQALEIEVFTVAKHRCTKHHHNTYREVAYSQICLKRFHWGPKLVAVQDNWALRTDCFYKECVAEGR
jgi:hypothetical protein